MNLIFFLVGAGSSAAVMLVLVCLVALRNGRLSERLHGYWAEANRFHRMQVEHLERIADAVEAMKPGRPFPPTDYAVVKIEEVTP